MTNDKRTWVFAVIFVGLIVVAYSLIPPYPEYEPSTVSLEWENIAIDTSIMTLHIGNATITMQEINGTIYIDGSNLVIRNLATKEDET